MVRRLSNSRTVTPALAVAMALAMLRPVHAAPADIFMVGAPTPQSGPPKAADVQVGDASVSTQTGAMQFSYPIPVPPGRNGMRPHLALAYSSQAPIYGGVANGWSLPIPMITEDTSDGRLYHQTPGSAAKKYQSSMAGGRPLVAVTEPHASDVAQTYRAQNDATFTRYERLSVGNNAIWRARSTDGNTYTFGEADHIGACAIVSDGYAPLTREVDPFGNEINYTYVPGVSGECILSAIHWGRNANAGVDDFASVILSYSLTTGVGCTSDILVGAQTSYRTGTKIVTGANQINTIRVTAYPPGQAFAPVHTRVIALSYSPDAGVEQTASCSSTHGAYRSLYSIQESAWGTDSPQVDLPAIKFSYGSAQFGAGALAWNSVDMSSVHLWTPAFPGLRYNLGWGYRFDTRDTAPDSGRWPTVEAMMIDVDGDGLLDRVTSLPVTDGMGRLHCGAQWSRNLGGFSFANPQPIAMPTLKWATNFPTDCAHSYDGSVQPNTYHASGTVEESCSLNYQRTNYFNSIANGICPSDGWSLCPSSPPVCSNGMDCGRPRSFPTKPTYLAFRWLDINGDGLVDLVASPSGGDNYDLQWGTGVNSCQAPPEPPLFGNWPACPLPSYTSAPASPFTPQVSTCNGMYPWMIYLNHGNGQFGQPSPDPYNPLPDSIVYQPMPLETSTGDSSLLAAPVAQYEGMFDIDGDGYLDGIFWNYGTPPWQVWRNDASGRYLPANNALPFSFNVGPSEFISKTDLIQIDADKLWHPISSVGLIDINGDGLADHWYLISDTTANIEFNDGVGFRQPAEVVGIRRPGNDGTDTECPLGGCQHFCNPSQPHGSTTCFWTRAARTDASRTLDLDLDGRPDLVQLQAGTPTAYLNHGSQFGSAAGLVGDNDGLLHKMVVSDQILSPKYTWEIRSDMLDLDGDGIPEGVDFGLGGEGTTQRITHITTPTQPPRLLVGIDNQRGAVTSVSYAPVSNPNVVQRDPGKVMPHTQWVVQSLTVTDSLASTTSITSYQYKNPHFSPEGDRDPAGTFFPSPPRKYAFRGFEQVTATSPSGAQTIQRYSYDVDWSGRLATTLVVPVEAPSEVRSIEETTWEARDLFFIHHVEALVKTYHATAVDHWTCKNGQDEAACRANTDTHTRTVSTLSALSSTTQPGGPALMWKETSARLQTSATAADGDRITDSTYVLAADVSNYRVLPARITKSVITGGAPVIYAKVAHTLDPSYRVALTDEVWFDTVDANRAITRRTYDMATGNMLQRWKPVQNAANTSHASYIYDSRKLLVATELREPAGYDNLSQQLDYVYEYGTGTRLETLGPNVAGCAGQPGGCTPGSSPKEDHRIRVDGLARMIERYETFSFDGSQYLAEKIETNRYVDGPAASVTHQSAIDSDPSQVIRYAQDKTDLDGHGRPIRKTVYVFGSAAADQVTTFQYNNDGSLRTVTMPDPTANDASTVTYTYSSDSLGRPTGIRRPDASDSADQSGVDISYDGLTSTSTEQVGTALGQPATTKTIKDAFGRLIEVDEQTSPSPTWANTVYTYGPDDHVIQIVDPEGITTQLTHDFAGHRTQITRNGRTWNYGYDKNGNLISIQVPGSPSPPITDPLYTTTIAYDDLDRPTSRSIGPRSLSSADQGLFGAGIEVYQWDHGLNHSGRLYTWGSYGPGASLPTTFIAPEWDAQGHQTDYHQEFAAPSPATGTLTRTFTRTYNEGGGLLGTYYQDYAAVDRATYSEIHYDERGLPSFALLSLSPSSTDQILGIHTRNVAGLVTRRYTDITDSPIAYAESNWVYDTLGRVTTQVVQTGPGPTPVARQDVAYFGNDDPKTLDQYLASNHKQFQYTFDLRHQLTNAVENTTPGYFSASYSYGLDGRFASANEGSSLAPGSEVKGRNVNYQYATGANTDPEEVATLTNVSDGTTYASYTYDAVGNQLTRCYGPGQSPLGGCQELTEYVYDGQDQLRRATRTTNDVLQGSEEYWYNNGARMIVLKRDAAGAPREMIWFIGDTEAHYDATFNPTHAYAQITIGTPVARVDTTNDGVAQVEYQFHGLGGSTLAAVDQATGTVNASFSYAPFGEIIEAIDAGGTKGVSAHRRRMNDKYVDEMSDLAYYGARYYDKTVMAWTQSDPVYRFTPDAAWAQPRRANLYTNDLNNPLRYVDPDGRNPVGAVVPCVSSFLAVLACVTVAVVSGLIVKHDGDIRDAAVWLKDEILAPAPTPTKQPPSLPEGVELPVSAPDDHVEVTVHETVPARRVGKTSKPKHPHPTGSKPNFQGQTNFWDSSKDDSNSPTEGSPSAPFPEFSLEESFRSASKRSPSVLGFSVEMPCLSCMVHSDKNQIDRIRKRELDSDFSGEIQSLRAHRSRILPY